MMTGNDDRSLVSSMARAVNALIEVAEDQCDESKNANASAREMASHLAASARRLESASDAIPRTLENIVGESLRGAAVEAARLLSGKFADANIEADAAAKRYRGAVADYEAATKIVRWQIMLPVGLFCITLSAVILGSAYLGVRSLIPSDNEARERRELIVRLDGEISTRQGLIQKTDDQIVKLRKTVQELKRRGGSVKMEDCSDAENRTHLCIRIFDSGRSVQYIVDEVSE